MKMCRKYIFLVMLGLALLLSCNQKDNVKYYRHLRMYKIHDLAFSYPVDPKDYKKINCYAVEYDESNRIVNIVYLRKGKPAYDDFNRLASVNIEYINNNEKWYRLNLKGKSIFKNVDYESYDFDSSGRLLSRTNYSDDGKIVEDTAGNAKYLYSTDSHGNVLKSLRSNIVGENIVDSIGYYDVRFKYDSLKNITEITNFWEDNRLLLNKYGFAIHRLKYDENNLHVEDTFYDEFDHRSSNSLFKASKVTYRYDINGYPSRIELFDKSDSLIFNDSLGFTYCKIRYSDSDDLIEVAKYDENNNPTMIEKPGESGKLKQRIIYATFWRQEQYKDEKYDYQVTKYDNMGNTIEISFYSSDDNPYEINGGYASIKSKFNKNGNVIETEYYSADGKLTEDRTTGIAIHKYKYDKNNFNVEVAKYGANGKLKNGKDDWVAKIISEYNDSIPLGTSFWGEDGKLKAPKGQNWARQKFYYDDKKRPKGFGFHGERDELVMSESFGFACNIIDYDNEDDIDNYIIYFFDADSNLIGESTDPPPPFKP